MDKIENEIFDLICGKCISAESARAAAELIKNFIYQNNISNCQACIGKECANFPEGFSRCCYGTECLLESKL